MKVALLVACLVCASSACGGHQRARSGRGGVLHDAAPPSDYERLGEVSVKSGEGCGVLGKGGSRDDAEARLEHEARKLGGSYVQVTSYEAPRPNHQCIEHEHHLSGVVYRAPAPVAPVTATSSTLPTSPPP